MHQFGGNAASLGIGLQIDVEVGLTVEGSFLHHLFDDVCHLQESTFATTEAGINDFIGSIDDAGHITALANGVKAELQTLELLVVWFEELQILCLEKVETLALQRQALREGEGILDRQAHIRHAQLGLDGSIHKLYGTMHHALRMDEHLYLVSRYAEKPLRFSPQIPCS